MPKVFVLYGTQDDLHDLLGQVSDLAGLRFVWLGKGGSAELAVSDHAAGLPSPLPSELCLCRPTSRLTPRTVIGTEGTQRLVLTPRDVSDGLWMQIGTTDADARMVCESRLFIVRDDPAYLNAFKDLGKVIRRLGMPGHSMGKIAPATFVLPHAADLFRSGWRLNQHIRMPTFNDIMLS